LGKTLSLQIWISDWLNLIKNKKSTIFHQLRILNLPFMRNLQIVLQVLLDKFHKYFIKKKKGQDFPSSILQVMNKSRLFKLHKNCFWQFTNLQIIMIPTQLLQRKNLNYHPDVSKRCNILMNKKVLMSTKSSRLSKINFNLWAYPKFVKKENFLRISLTFNQELTLKIPWRI